MDGDSFTPEGEAARTGPRRAAQGGDRDAVDAAGDKAGGKVAGPAIGRATDRPSLTTILGRNPVIEALRSGRPISKVMIARGIDAGFAALVKSLARDADVPVVEVDRARLDALAAGQRHQGVAAMGAVARYYEVNHLLDRAGEDGLVVVLDGIEDPRNLGAIMRTCDAVGATGVIVPKRRACGLTSAVARASAGAAEYVPCARTANLAREVERLKERGFWVFGADAGAARTIYEADFTGRVAVVIGSEGSGISRLLAEKCDFLVRIPTLGRVSSLNASVAAAVIMFEVLRQRRATRGE